MSNQEQLVPLQHVVDAVHGVVVPQYAFQQESPHASLRVVQRAIEDSLRADQDWTQHYKFIPRHVTARNAIMDGIDEMNVPEKAKKMFRELVVASYAAPRDTMGSASL